MIKKQLKGKHLDRDIDLFIYLPTSYNKQKRYPVIYMHDGQNLSDPSLTTYGHVWNVESLKEFKVREVIIVGINSPYIEGRTDELCPYQNEMSKGLGRQYLDEVEEVVKYIDKHYLTIPNPENRLLMGSSMGGLITTYAAVYYTHLYKNFACLSNAYWVDERILEEVPNIKGVKYYMDVGTDEGRDGYVELNDKAYDLLQNEDSLYIKVPGAIHNEEEWAVRFPMIVRWFYGGEQ